jgi:hypothetical protein
MRTALLLLAGLLGTGAAEAQGTTSGCVTDPNGGVLPGVDVVASNAASRQKVVTKPGAAMTSNAHAQDTAPLVGVWRLLSYVLEFKDGSPTKKLFGDGPPGYLVFTPQGRMMAVIEATDRKPATTDQERAALYLSMIAYSGAYRLEGDTWTTTVDVAWSPLLHNTEQLRYYKIEGDRLTVTSPWGPDPRLPQQPETRHMLVWQKVK